jgi:hypothetical protein
MATTGREKIKGTRADFYITDDITKLGVKDYLGSVLINGFPEILNERSTKGLGVSKALLIIRNPDEFEDYVKYMVETVNWPHEHETSYHTDYTYIYNRSDDTVHCFKKGEWFDLEEYYQDREIHFPQMKEVW